MPQTILQNSFFGNLSWEFAHGLKASVGRAGITTRTTSTTPSGVISRRTASTICWVERSADGGWKQHAVQYQRVEQRQRDQSALQPDLADRPGSHGVWHGRQGLPPGRHGSALRRLPDRGHPGNMPVWEPAVPGRIGTMRPADQALVDADPAGAHLHLDRELPQCQRPGRAAVQLGLRVGLRDRHQERALRPPRPVQPDGVFRALDGSADCNEHLRLRLHREWRKRQHLRPGGGVPRQSRLRLRFRDGLGIYAQQVPERQPHRRHTRGLRRAGYAEGHRLDVAQLRLNA